MADMTTCTTKEVGDYGEKAAAQYLKAQTFSILERNYRRKTGEIDIIARRYQTIHCVEVKTRLCHEFPLGDGSKTYDPSANLHATKIERIARTGTWYMAEKNWNGEWQIDAILVWVRARDGATRVSYISQIYD